MVVQFAPIHANQTFSIWPAYLNSVKVAAVAFFLLFLVFVPMLLFHQCCKSHLNLRGPNFGPFLTFAVVFCNSLSLGVARLSLTGTPWIMWKSTEKQHSCESENWEPQTKESTLLNDNKTVQTEKITLSLLCRDWRLAPAS